MRRQFILLLILVLVATFAGTTVFAQQSPIPTFPHAFFGTVEINGAPAPAGTQIEARGVNVKILPDDPAAGNPLTTTESGKYGGPTRQERKLVVQGEIENGSPIEFYVGGVKAECAEVPDDGVVPDGAWQSSFPFTSSLVTHLNLRVGAPAQPTATSTATTAPTTGASSGPTPTTGPAPTATRLTTGPTNTPVQAAAPTTQATAPAGATARPGSAPTALPGSVVATPTGLAPQAAGPAASATPEPAPLAAATAAPTEAQVAVVATPLPTRTPAAVAQVVTSEPILKEGTQAAPPTAAPSGAEAGSGRSVALWGGLGALLIAIAVGVFIKVRH